MQPMALQVAQRVLRSAAGTSCSARVGWGGLGIGALLFGETESHCEGTLPELGKSTAPIDCLHVAEAPPLMKRTPSSPANGAEDVYLTPTQLSPNRTPSPLGQTGRPARS